MSNKTTKVRLQVHVDEDLARRIDELAKGMNRSMAWMVAELLDQAVRERQRFGDWLTWRMIKLLGDADPRKLLEKFARAKGREAQKGTVYVQTHVSPELAENLERLANAYQRTRADMTTQLLNWTLDDTEWLIQIATNRWASAIYDSLDLPRGYQSPDNREENRSRGGEPVEPGVVPADLGSRAMRAAG